MYISSNDNAPHPPLAPSNIFEHLQHISLSLCTPSTLQMTTPLLSLPLVLSNIFRALKAHISLSALHAPANHHTPPLAPSRSLSLSLTYRYRGAADSGHAASACDVHHKTQKTRQTCARLLPALPNATTSKRLAPMDRAGILLRKSVNFFDLHTKLSNFGGPS